MLKLLFSLEIVLLGVSSSLREIFPTDAGQLSDKLKFLAGQNKILQDRRLVCCQITISFCQKSQDICQTSWNFLQDRMKICRFCQTVLQFSQRLIVRYCDTSPTIQYSYRGKSIMIRYNFNESLRLYNVVSNNSWMSGKQYIPWWDTTFLSGSTLLAQACQDKVKCSKV